MVVLACADDAKLFVSVDGVEFDDRVAAEVLPRHRDNSALLVLLQGVHDDGRLGGHDLDTRLGVCDVAAFDLRHVALVYFDAWSSDVDQVDSQDLLACAFSLAVHANYFAVLDLRVLDTHDVAWLRKSINASRVELSELAVRDEDM